ncbi:MAG: NUDIX domain-containing protein [Propionibacteriaceae bacterium]|jgi:8-oxo-dGTP pyrophosphatase MutT (NUDIX family)|nr:NUDIX domain-containing protein [Propionibacteriaceae bacterium]
MRIVGVQVPGGAPVFTATLPHGIDPQRLAGERGYRIVRPLSSTGSAPALTVTVQVVRNHGESRLPPVGPRAVDRGLDLDNSPRPIVRQRLAAYGIVLSGRGILATQFSELTAVPGLWGLPGGGIDSGESPSQALVREVAEETGQALEISQLLDVQSDHWIGRAPNGVVEDFHAVRIIYSGRCVVPDAPVVHDVGGTTADATWVSLADWSQQPWTASARALLDRHLAEVVAAGTAG